MKCEGCGKNIKHLAFVYTIEGMPGHYCFKSACAICEKHGVKKKKIPNPSHYTYGNVKRDE